MTKKFDETQLSDVAFVSFSTPDKDQVSICAKDLSTGEVLMTYSGGSCARGTLNILRCSYIIGADEHRPLIYIWALNKKEPTRRIRTPGRVNCLNVSSSNSFCVGSIDGTLYLWTIPTGNLNSVIEHHLTKVTCIKFSTTGLDFVSCDGHGSVALWNVSRILSQDKEDFHPLTTFTGHSAMVTDAHLNEIYLATSSLDRSVRVWDLRSGQSIHNFSLDGPVTSVTIDPTLKFLIAGFDGGRIIIKDISDKNSTDVTFRACSDVICMDWTSKGVLLAGESEGKLKKLCQLMSFWNEVVTHHGRITNVALLSPLLSKWNDPSAMPHFDMTPLSIILNVTPNLLTTPLNYQTSHKRTTKQSSSRSQWTKTSLPCQPFGGAERDGAKACQPIRERQMEKEEILRHVKRRSSKAEGREEMTKASQPMRERQIDKEEYLRYAECILKQI